MNILYYTFDVHYTFDVQQDIHEFLNFFSQNLCSSLNRVKVQPTLIVD
jgi:ubiquitin C-terminal hydrolase